MCHKKAPRRCKLIPRVLSEKYTFAQSFFVCGHWQRVGQLHIARWMSFTSPSEKILNCIHLVSFCNKMNFSNLRKLALGKLIIAC